MAYLEEGSFKILNVRGEILARLLRLGGCSWAPHVELVVETQRRCALRSEEQSNGRTGYRLDSGNGVRTMPVLTQTIDGSTDEGDSNVQAVAIAHDQIQQRLYQLDDKRDGDPKRQNVGAGSRNVKYSQLNEEKPKTILVIPFLG